MEHLTAEALARLVDDEPTREERAHLASCRACADELEAFVDQTRALGALPEILPPRGDWAALEARLRSEGLVRDPGLLARLRLARTPSWMRLAASILLFGLGALSGAGWATRAMAGPVADGTAAAGSATLAASEISDVDDAALAVRSAEERYVEAMARYRELLALTGSDGTSADPIGRYAALEHLVLVSRAALRQAPGDPFLNGLLASALAERDAAARLVSTGRDNWF